MGFFGKLVKGALDVALLPVDIAKDVVTGGILEDEPATVKRVKKVVTDVEEAGEDAGEGDWL